MDHTKGPYINALYSPLIPMPEIVVLAYLGFAKSGVFVLWFLNDRSHQERSLGPQHRDLLQSATRANFNHYYCDLIHSSRVYQSICGFLSSVC